MADSLTGGCLCGGLRYQIAGPPNRVVHCHCTMCRRGSGGTVVTWAIVPADGFRFTAGRPAEYASSPGAIRRFCPTCGAQITFAEAARAHEIDITVATLDDPAACPADHHVWPESRIPWLHLDQHLPDMPEAEE